MGEIKITRNSPNTETVFIEPCIKCGGEEINIGDCGYSSFNVAYGKCKNPKCKHEITFGCGWNIDEKDIVEIWNKKNSIDLIVDEKQIQITALKNEISELKKLKRLRNKKS